MRDSHRGVCADAISPVMEALEDRRMLSASLLRGALKVGGGAGDDTISVRLNAAKTKITVKDGAATKSFTRTAVKSISILTGDGADKIAIGPGIKQQITIKSGAGNDTVTGGSGREIIFAGAGDDSILAGSGSDQVFGEAGNDIISGGSSNDYLYGDAGDDNLSGDSGNDVLAGDFENSLVFSGEAPRVEGNDVLNGGDGNDWLLGERRWTGSEFAGNGQDTYTGGPGADVIDINKDGNDTITDEETGDFVPVNEVAQAEENQPGDVHEHAILKIRVRKGSGYKNALIPVNVGAVQPGFFAFLHTHDTTGTIHFEAGPPLTTYQLFEFFRVWGISMDKSHVGRFVPPAGKKMTMVVKRGSSTFATTKFGSFIPANSDVIEIRVG